MNWKILRKYSEEQSLYICCFSAFLQAFFPAHPLTTASSSYAPDWVFKRRHS